MVAVNWKKSLRKIWGGDAESIQKQVRQSNAKRALYLATGAVVINIFFLLHFYFNVKASTPVEIKWRKSILLLHAVFFGLHLVLLGTAIYIKRTKQYQGNLSLFLITALFIGLPLWGAAAVVIDQWVTTSIISFFLTCAVCAMGLLMRPVFSLVYYILVYILFYCSIALTQTNVDILLTNRANAFAGIAICCGVSVLLWRNNLVRYMQNNLIQQQKKDIQENYEKLLASTEELTKANAAKDKFFSIIAHDLRGPVTSTLALTRFISTNAFGDDPERQKELMQLLHNSIDSTAKLLENLLVWSRSQTNRISFAPVLLNLYKLIETNVNVLNIVASEKDINVSVDVDRDVEIYADAEMMNTVLRNLLSNALKFTNKFGNVTITAKIISKTPPHNNCVQVCVQDDGTGMQPAVLESLFRIDTKVVKEGTGKETGTGLGLILCKEFIEKHSGSIWATSKPGTGSRFTFELPMPADKMRL
ncbi:MAG TPA: HAMP domain-containing sensor histidine kinase [Chitinophagaceae bacterium]|nr:HAMP domain-containing sensor histidine kinase [Chitinophagaceae bacterium]